MGLFCVNFHFRKTNDKALAAALSRRRISNQRVLPAKAGWTTLYEEQASQQDEQRIRALGMDLSSDLKTAGIAFMVHDSDIACYWLFENGRLLDEFNSCPDYFDDDGGGESGSSGGDVDLLLRFCRTGVSADDLTAVLTGEQVFAEQVIEKLAEALGIDPERALSDYRDLADGDGPGGSDDFGGDEDDDDGSNGGPSILSFPGGADNAEALRERMASQLTAMFGAPATASDADPQAAALTKAAADDDLAEIDRLLDTGAAIDADAPTFLPNAQPMTNFGQVFPGGAPRIAMSPLLAAISHKKKKAVQRLLERGADPNRAHLIFGPPVHVAIGAGEVELLQLLIDHGADLNSRNARGQTAVDVVAACRATRERMRQAQEMMKSMGMKLPGAVDQLSNIALPTEGWEACERLLRERG